LQDKENIENNNFLASNTAKNADKKQKKLPQRVLFSSPDVLVQKNEFLLQQQKNEINNNNNQNSLEVSTEEVTPLKNNFLKLNSNYTSENYKNNNNNKLSSVNNTNNALNIHNNNNNAKLTKIQNINKTYTQEMQIEKNKILANNTTTTTNVANNKELKKNHEKRISIVHGDGLKIKNVKKMNPEKKLNFWLAKSNLLVKKINNKKKNVVSTITNDFESTTTLNKLHCI
jgi:hypothetical protein